MQLHKCWREEVLVAAYKAGNMYSRFHTILRKQIVRHVAGLNSARPISTVAGVRVQASTSHVQPLADPIVEAALTMLYPERRLLERKA